MHTGHIAKAILGPCITPQTKETPGFSPTPPKFPIGGEQPFPRTLSRDVLLETSSCKDILLLGQNHSCARRQTFTYLQGRIGEGHGEVSGDGVRTQENLPQEVRDVTTTEWRENIAILCANSCKFSFPC